jgi:SAM-dependent methyltransferase
MQPTDLTRLPQTDPTLIYRYRDALYATDLLTVALVELDLFTWLKEHPGDKEAICRHFGITARPTDVMLTLLTAMGFLEVRSGAFHPTQLAREHLAKDSPWFLGPYYASLKDRPVCRDFLVVLRTGKPANWGSLKNEKAWAQAMEDTAFASQFTAAMDCRGIFLGEAVARALDLSRHSRFLDIAGGSGIYACCVAARHPHMRATVFEKPPVDRVASGLIAERGFAGRVAVMSGDMFTDPLPADHDVHLFSNVLHDWDEPVVRRLLSNSFNALRKGGMLVVHDAHLNADKSGPLHVAEYSALLMHATEGKCYSVAEMGTFLRETGFVEDRFTPTAAARSIITAVKP